MDVITYRSSECAHLDQTALKRLIEDSFERTLKKNYFEQHFSSVYLYPWYKGVAIVVEGVVGVPYLDKFAVTPALQKNGVGGKLWARLRAGNPRFYWRSRRDNPINTWYQTRADGCRETGQWVVFWRGLEGNEIEVCVEHAVSLLPSFEP